MIATEIFGNCDVLTMHSSRTHTYFPRYPYGSSTQSNTVVLIHDAFQDLSYWNGFMTSGFDGVAMDTHIYQMFSDAVRPPDGR